MNTELQKKLYEKYPKIFRQRNLTPQQTAMCWGITCGDGWYNIIDILCYQIQNYVDNNPSLPQVEAVQVKSKWGGLRFYVTGVDDYIRGLIAMAEGMSTITKEWNNKEKFYDKHEEETLPPKGSSSSEINDWDCTSMGELKI